MANSSVFRVKVGDQWVDIPAVQGTNGVSVSMRLNGNYLQYKYSDSELWITVFDFSTIETVKGDPGDPGAPGADGTDGTDGVGISWITLTSVGNNYVLTFTMTDSTTKTVSFPKPTNGYTPVRGTDYWTQADIDSMHQYIDDQILGGAW